MKTLLLLCLISVIFSANILAMPEAGIPERIQTLFHEEFPNVENPDFFKAGDTYMVYFKNDNNSSERVYYNSDAEMVETVKYYTENELEPFIHEKVNRKYKGKTIVNVTEVISDAEHFYEIILQGDETWYDIKSDSKGSMQIQKRWKGNV